MFSFMFVAVLNNWAICLYSLITWVIYLLLNWSMSGEYSLKLIMIFLSLWIVAMMMLSVENAMKNLDLYMVMMLMFLSLFISFFSESMLGFYLGFEVSIIPILLILFGWGYQPDRLEAGLYLIMYTILFSLPLLMGIYIWESKMATRSFFMYLIMVMAFLAKFPMFIFHLWLPRAHVEAPVYGSMILAGVMLKLGGFGIYKISLMMGDIVTYYSNFLIMFSMLGGVYLSVVCFMQTDMKMLIAYSSIVHMSIVISGMLTMRESGLWGGVYMMVGHGLCSSGLFYILGATYSKTLTRSIYLNKGLINILPTASLWWFLFCSSNLSFPPSLNLGGEILLFSSILSWSGGWVSFLIILLSVSSSLYSIYLYSYSQHGQSLSFYSLKFLSLNEFMVMLLHWIPLNLIMLDLSLMSF
uniref:NADH-ubiquinone oxidoreductase chain 4 n=1 Tax=Calophya schini TaxID=121824 RepID=A0A343LDQ7_9HEMI|nr:NADH dehydrogenase subunit 4 [Calophya schini]